MISRRRFVAISMVALAYVAVSPVVFAITLEGLHVMLAWNIFLAYIPFLLAYLLHRPIRKTWLLWILLCCWLFMFPNAFYLLTDFIYVDKDAFMVAISYQPYEYLRDLPAYLGLFHILIGAGLGVVMGLLSLESVRAGHLAKCHKLPAWFAVLIVFLLASFAIYLGRFLRFNSWDVINPFRIIREFLDSFDWFAVFFIAMFFLIHNFVYFLFRIVATREDDQQVVAGKPQTIEGGDQYQIH